MWKYLLLSILFAIPVCQSLPVNALPIAETGTARRESGTTIANIQGKDLVHPTLSPDGKFLAYAEVIADKKGENTAVRILNLATKQSFLLISPQVAAKYRTYRAFVSYMDWQRADRLVVAIDDGDVDRAILTFDPTRKKLLSESSQDIYDPTNGAAKLRQKILARFPYLKSGILSDLKKIGWRVETPDLVILRGEVYDGKDNLWSINFKERTIEPLFKDTDSLIKSILESSRVASNGDILLVLAKGEQRFLVTYHRGKITKRQPLPQIDGNIRLVHATDDSKVWIIAYKSEPSAQGNNPLYLLERGQLRQSTEYKSLYDVSVDDSGTRIAYCYWSGGKRQIVVKKL